MTDMNKVYENVLAAKASAEQIERRNAESKAFLKGMFVGGVCALAGMAIGAAVAAMNEDN